MCNLTKKTKDRVACVSLIPCSFFYIVPNVAHVALHKRGLCLPLDLSRNVDVPALLTAETAFRTGYLSKERNDNRTMLYHSSKAITDGRIGPVASGKICQCLLRLFQIHLSQAEEYGPVSVLHSRSDT